MLLYFVTFMINTSAWAETYLETEAREAVERMEAAEKDYAKAKNESEEAEKRVSENDTMLGQITGRYDQANREAMEKSQALKRAQDNLNLARRGSIGY